MGFKGTTRRLEVSLKGHAVYGQDDEYPVAYTRGKTLGEYLDLMGLTGNEGDNEKRDIVSQLQEFGEALTSWNLEREDGSPIPCTREALFGEVDNDLALALATKWLDVLGGKVDAPLPDSSPAGGPSLVASIPTETLSSLPEPTSVPA